MIRSRLTRSTRWAFGFAGALGLVLCTNPLFGIQGVESALWLGALLSPWAAAIGASFVSRARETGDAAQATELLWRALGAAWSMLVVPVAMLALNALRVRNCTPVEGAVFMLLGPFASVTLSCVWGVLLGAAHPRVGFALALAGPLGGITLALWRFYSTAAIHSFGHFFGFFPGTLYDEALVIPTPLLTLRAVTLAYTVGLGCLFVGHYVSATQQLSLRAQRSRLFGISGMLCLGIVLAAEHQAHALGHATSSAWMTERLGRTLEGARCRVVLPREVNLEEAKRLRDDCDFRVEQMERVIGVTQRGRVTAFFFRSPEEKRFLMGAANTYIAKPWRQEVYLQIAGWPHPVLAHEIAHVVAGNLASGPFRVAARAHGLWPEAALIEGLAVAAAWDASEGLTPHQWARAMLELGRSPRLHDLLGLGFLSQPKDRAYVLAGSFLRFIAERHGWKAVRDVYRAGDVSPLGRSLAVLEAEWRTYVLRVDMPAMSRALAAQRFSRGSIFSTVCPHLVANLRAAAQSDFAAQDLRQAIASCNALLDIDPADTWARSALVTAHTRELNLPRALAQLARLQGPPAAAAPVIAAAKHAIADATWRAGDHQAAGVAYESLRSDAANEDLLRLLEVKAMAVQAPGPEARLLREILVGPQGVPPDAATTVQLANQLASLRTDGLGEYLAARQLFHVQRFDLASALLRAALARGLPTRLLHLAALRLLATAYHATGNMENAAQTWRNFAAHGDAHHALEAHDWLQRARWQVARALNGHAHAQPLQENH